LLCRVSQFLDGRTQRSSFFLCKPNSRDLKYLGEPTSEKHIAHCTGQRRAMLGFPLKTRAAGGSENGRIVLQ
jgi:hypothetical protein